MVLTPEERRERNNAASKRYKDRNREEVRRKNREHMREFWQGNSEALKAEQNRRYAEDPEFRAMKDASTKRYRASEKFDRSRYRRQEKDYELRQKYGITLDDYEQMLLDQEGRCAACQVAAKSQWGLHVDHHHDNGHVRGLLCFSCNASAGQAGDDPDRLVAIAAYLIRSEDSLRVTKESL